MSKTKYCPRCYRTKPVNEFYFYKNSKDNLQTYCKECSYEYKKIRRDNDPLRKEKERMYEQRRQQKIANGEMPHRAAAVILRTRNKNVISQIIKDPNVMSEERFIRNFGCSKKTFITKFENEFKKNPGMGWHNYGAWHMDHIKPLGSFPLDTEANKKLANHYTNLRPIWATANMNKGKKYAVEQKI